MDGARRGDGDCLGDHGLLYKGCRFYEGLVHVPLIVSWPGTFQEGVRSSALVELVDVAPNLLEAAGLAVPEPLDGVSLGPILRDEGEPHYHRSFIRSEYRDALDLPDHSHASMVFDGRYKLVLYHGHALGELFDLQEDASEFDNLWDEPDATPIIERLRAPWSDQGPSEHVPAPERVGGIERRGVVGGGTHGTGPATTFTRSAWRGRVRRRERRGVGRRSYWKTSTTGSAYSMRRS